jgi:hypothetical protein
MQGCHSRVARRLVGVGSQMASIRSASIGPFGSFTTSGEGLKLPVSEFHPILRQYSRCPFSRLSCTADRKGRTAARPTSALAGPRLKELKVWRLACPDSPYDLVFPNRDGRPMSYRNLIARGFRPALKRAGIRRIRFHDLRHTFASLMISNGEDIVRVSRLMGHANASFTFNVYCHMLPRKRDPSGGRLASLVFGNKMETNSNPETQLELPGVENLR